MVGLTVFQVSLNRDMVSEVIFGKDCTSTPIFQLKYDSTVKGHGSNKSFSKLLSQGPSSSGEEKRRWTLETRLFSFAARNFIVEKRNKRA